MFGAAAVMNSNKTALIVSVLLLAFYAEASRIHAGDDLQEHENWIGPNIPEVLKADKYKWRSGSDKFYLMDSGDYNGDGILDHVAMMERKDRLKEGLWVRLGNSRGLGQWQILATHPSGERGLADTNMGVETLLSGEYETVMCYNFDENGQCLSEITIKNDSILYFRFASSSRIFWWNEASKSFETFWYSD